MPNPSCISLSVGMNPRKSIMLPFTVIFCTLYCESWVVIMLCLHTHFPVFSQSFVSFLSFFNHNFPLPGGARSMVLIASAQILELALILECIHFLNSWAVALDRPSSHLSMHGPKYSKLRAAVSPGSLSSKV